MKHSPTVVFSVTRSVPRRRGPSPSPWEHSPDRYFKTLYTGTFADLCGHTDSDFSLAPRDLRRGSDASCIKPRSDGGKGGLTTFSDFSEDFPSERVSDNGINIY
jgi:hypothetical protein